MAPDWYDYWWYSTANTTTSNTVTFNTGMIDALAIAEPNKPTKPKTAVDWLDEQIAVIRNTGRQALSPA